MDHKLKVTDRLRAAWRLETPTVHVTTAYIPIRRARGEGCDGIHVLSYPVPSQPHPISIPPPHVGDTYHLADNTTTRSILRCSERRTALHIWHHHTVYDNYTTARFDFGIRVASRLVCSPIMSLLPCHPPVAGVASESLHVIFSSEESGSIFTLLAATFGAPSSGFGRQRVRLVSDVHTWPWLQYT